ncbi:MAG: adenylate/guanylate cyclase domain-containing protein [Myxococcota bacterium]|nr:adenylate/guanylate cyclase domain-containing protein [Myxococcota bacterium]
MTSAITTADSIPASQKSTTEEQSDRVVELETKLRQCNRLLEISESIMLSTSSEDSLGILMEAMVQETLAERGTLYLNDANSAELYSKILIGNTTREIRIMNTSGIAGYVFQTGKTVTIPNVYEDDRFDKTIDEKTGYKTRGMITTRIETKDGNLLGIAQVLNKKGGDFTEDDEDIMCAIVSQAALAIRKKQIIEQMQEKQKEEMQFLDVVSDITSEIHLTTLLQKVMSEATRMLHADRGTLFLNDEKTNELYTEVGQGLDIKQIRFPNHVGIAGAVFQTAHTINIPYAYADLRFNPIFDQQTGYFTRSILCVPVANKQGKVIGVTQILNRTGGSFNAEDESRLRAFTAQIAIALENAKLFNDIQNIQNYTNSMLQSMSNGVLTCDENGTIVTCNRAGASIFSIRRDDLLGKPIEFLLSEGNSWLVDRIRRVHQTGETDELHDAEIPIRKATISLNITIMPLVGSKREKLGTLVMLEDISNEKRVMSTMSRYMDPGLAEQLLSSDEDMLGGKSTNATVLFSDIRSFTTITEKLGAQGTVKMLNEYFTIMVDCIQREGGMLDKFIGDAIMAGFGIPIAHDDNEDKAVRAAISMLRELDEWNVKRQKRGDLPIDMGIGLNSDTVVSGNIGSPKRMDFTMIGDGVNLAARLESACKSYSARLLISEYTHARLKGTYRSREIDRVIVKGKSQPVVVYEVLEHHTESSFPNMMEAISFFRSGMSYYKEQSWEQAINSFNKALNLNPKDALCQTYIDRCNHQGANPPGKDWNGVWVMTSKS